MITTVVFVRHGQTDWNVAGRWQGEADIPLNENGRSQAQKVAQRLASWSLAGLVSSDLQRAAATAAAIGEACGLTPLAAPDWRERCVGDFSGLTGADVREQYPEIVAQAHDGVIEPPNGERYADLHRRAVAAYERVVADFAGQTVCVVSHGATLAVVLSHVLGIPYGKFGRFRLSGNTGISVVAVQEGQPRVLRMNDTAHLE